MEYSYILDSWVFLLKWNLIFVLVCVRSSQRSSRLELTAAEPVAVRVAVPSTHAEQMCCRPDLWRSVHSRGCHLLFQGKVCWWFFHIRYSSSSEKAQSQRSSFTLIDEWFSGLILGSDSLLCKHNKYYLLLLCIVNTFIWFGYLSYNIKIYNNY